MVLHSYSYNRIFLLLLMTWGVYGFSPQVHHRHRVACVTRQRQEPTQSITLAPHSPITTRHTSMMILKATDDSEEEYATQEDRLLSLLTFLQNRQAKRKVCGLDATEQEQNLVSQVVQDVEQDNDMNLVTRQDGKISFEQLEGDWNLLFTNSRTMIINKSLSGLGRSESDMARHTSLIQKLSGNKYLGTAELVEQFGDKEEGGITVSIPGEWFTQPETSNTGKPTTSIEIVPERVMYGPVNAKADDWSSLGPIKRLDLIYLSRDIMISRVNINPDYFFIWQRLAP